MFLKRSKSRDLEKQLIAAQRRLNLAVDSLAPKHKGGEVEEFHAASDEVLRLERALAESRNEPYAVPFGFPVKWDIGAPMPFLLCNDYRACLTFYVDDPDPNWDGTYVNVVEPQSAERVKLCLVEFEHCASAKLGHPNDEVQNGHPLAGKGLEGYTAQIVKNSPWLREVAKTNSAHEYDDPGRWELMNHYVFWFHDSTFECLAESYKVEVTCETLTELLSRVQQRLLQ